MKISYWKGLWLTHQQSNPWLTQTRCTSVCWSLIHGRNGSRSQYVLPCMENWIGIHMHIYALSTKTHISKCQKNLTKKSSCTSPQYMCVGQVSWKPIFLRSIEKLKKYILLKALLLAPNFLFLLTRYTTSRFFMKRFYERVAHEDVRVKFLF
jgi:hypothetical protein